MIPVSQIDLNGNPVSDNIPSGGIPSGAVIPTPGRLAVMAATGGDIRLLLVILIAMELPVSGIFAAAGC